MADRSSNKTITPHPYKIYRTFRRSGSLYLNVIFSIDLVYVNVNVGQEGKSLL